MTPVVSILMPVYNAERYLRDAIESIESQVFSDFEFIIVNDGSTDRSASLLEETARRDAHIRLVTKANSGIIAALNDGLSLVRGEYVARMDADDIALPNRLKIQVAYLNDHPECSVIGSQVIFIDPDGDEIGPKPDLCTSHEQIDAALMAGQWPMIHPAVMIRTDAIRRLGGYRDYKTWEDHDLFLRLAEAGRLANLSQPLLYYRLHLGSIVHQRADLKSNVLAAILQDARQRRGLPPLIERELPKYRALTPVEHRRNWVWWALASGHARTARKHAWAAYRSSPLNWDSWRALYCSIRG